MTARLSCVKNWGKVFIMSKGLRVVLMVFVAFLTISFLHVWLNIGFDKIELFQGKNAQASSLRVGYLPVT